MRTMRIPRGEGRVGCVIWLALLAVVVLIAWTAVPVKIQSAEFESFAEEQAKFAGAQSAERITRRLLERADEMEIPLKEKDLEVRKGRDRIKIHYSYTVPLEFPFYTYDWTFEVKIDRQFFVM